MYSAFFISDLVNLINDLINSVKSILYHIVFKILYIFIINLINVSVSILSDQDLSNLLNINPTDINRFLYSQRLDFVGCIICTDFRSILSAFSPNMSSIFSFIIDFFIVFNTLIFSIECSQHLHYHCSHCISQMFLRMSLIVIQ